MTLLKLNGSQMNNAAYLEQKYTNFQLWLARSGISLCVLYLGVKSALGFTRRTIRSCTRDISLFVGNGYARRMERRGP